MDFPTFMRKARGDMSLYRLAKLTRISATQLTNYEKGKSEPTLKKAAAICHALRVVFVIGSKRREEKGKWQS